MTDIRIVVTGGHIYETSCAADDPLLATIAATIAGTAVPAFLTIRVESNRKTKGVSIPVGAIVAIETDPPIEPARTERAPQMVASARYLRIPDFLEPEENRHLLDYVTSHEADFIASKVDAST